MEFPQVLLKLLGQVVPRLIPEWIFDGLPLVDSNYNGPSLLYYFLYQCEVVDNKGGERIHDVDYNVGLLDVQHGTYLHFSEILFVVLFDVGRIEPSSVNELYLSIFVLDLGSNGVSRSMRYLGHHHLILAYDLVDEGGFSNIGPTYEADLNNILHADVLNLCSSCVGKPFFWFDQEVFVVIFIKVFILLGGRVYLSEITLPFLYLEFLLTVVLFDVFLEFNDQLLKSLQPLLPAGSVRLFYLVGNTVIDVVQQFKDACPFLGRSGKDLLEAKLGSFVYYFALIEEVIAFVTDQSNFGMASEGLQIFGEFHFLRGNGFFGIDNEQNEVGFMNGCDGLLEYFLLEFIGVRFSDEVGLYSWSVDD